MEALRTLIILQKYSLRVSIFPSRGGHWFDRRPLFRRLFLLGVGDTGVYVQRGDRLNISTIVVSSVPDPYPKSCQPVPFLYSITDFHLRYDFSPLPSHSHNTTEQKCTPRKMPFRECFNLTTSVKYATIWVYTLVATDGINSCVFRR